MKSKTVRQFFVQILLTLIASSSLYSQKINLFGTVRDVNTHQELRAVNIFLENTQLGTTSNYSGRFTLTLPNSAASAVVVFQHIAYETMKFKVDSLINERSVYLQPRIIPMPGIEIEETGVSQIAKDLPQTVSMIEARNFEIRGFTDAGDLLRVDHSVQIDERISGRKTVSIRGGNPDDVVVLYNGVKLNNNFDNVYDFAMIDLEDVERIEIIKGSNTAIYGPEAFSGVVNIVPKLEQDYTIRFQQRLGTYRSGNWGLHLFKKIDRLRGSYSLRRGGLERPFVNDQGQLTNTSLHHNVNLNYSFSKDNNLSLMGVFPTLEYDKVKRFNDSARLELGDESNKNQLYSMRYTGDLSFLKNIGITVSYKKLVQDQFLDISNDPVLANNGILNRDIDDKAVQLNAEKNYNFGALDILFGYQLESAELDFLNDSDFNEPDDIKNAKLKRNHHGFVSIAKYRGETGSDFLQTFDLSVSLRQDIVDDEQFNLVSQQGNNLSDVTNHWNDRMFKFSMNLAGYRSNLLVSGFLNFGKNVKFPTLFQQVNSTNSNVSLSQEKNSSLELGLTVSRDLGNSSAIDGFQASVNYFQNTFDNKIRTFTSFTSTESRYDNVQDAKISGFESKSNVFMFHKKITFSLGLSRYFISDKTAFPFKSSFKRTVNLSIDHLGYSFQIHWFKEGEQEATLFFPDRTRPPEPVTLEGYENLDIHLSKIFEISKLKLFVNASGRNLLDDDNTELQGLALRDRRYYVTFGAQY